MHRTPLQTLLAERLQSAKGLGWDMPENSPMQKGGCMAQPSRNPPQPPFFKGGSQAGWAVFALPSLLSAWLRVIR